MLKLQINFDKELKKIQTQPINLKKLEKLSQEIANILQKAIISQREKSNFEYIYAIIESKKLLHSEYLHINKTKYSEIFNTFQRKSHITLNKEKIDKDLDNYKNLLDICKKMEKYPDQYQNATKIKLYLIEIINDLTLLHYLIHKFSDDIKSKQIPLEQAKKLKEKLLNYKQAKQTDMFKQYIDTLNSYIVLNKIRSLDQPSKITTYLKI